MYYFNPRSPHGERRDVKTYTSFASRFQPTLPARGATLRRKFLVFANSISTHAPRTGSDGLSIRPRRCTADFNPRSPHGERQSPCSRPLETGKFQPTLPARGATSRKEELQERHRISTHAPRTGSDRTFPSVLHPNGRFQPTLPARGATGYIGQGDKSDLFQPTLPARGATPPRTRRRLARCYFNPRSPHGERPARSAAAFSDSRFQPTLPARGAT